jgi:hypothetical protein
MNRAEFLKTGFLAAFAAPIIAKQLFKGHKLKYQLDEYEHPMYGTRVHVMHATVDYGRDSWYISKYFDKDTDPTLVKKSIDAAVWRGYKKGKYPLTAIT